MKRALLALTVLFCALCWSSPARADPISIALAIAGKVAWSAAIASSISMAISIGASLLLKKKPRPFGQKLDLAIGGDQPLSIAVGLTATAGQLIYAGSWGQDGKTPNAYLTYVIALTDAPVDGLNGLYVAGERVTLSGASAPQGDPVAQYTVGGKPHLWVRFYDGRQIDADAFLTSTFGAAPRPWTNDFIGVGRAYAIVTMRYNREVFNSVPSFLFELRGIRCYDPTQDDTVGGSGPHRENTPSTWEWTDNATIIKRHLLRGVRFGDEWLYGGQTISPARLPHDAWVAAANAGFRCGAIIECDVEPADALDRLTAATGGRLAEIGGVYKPRAAAPGAPVWAFTDDDVIITEGSSLEPFETLARRHNKVEASYPEPLEAWTPKPAPARRDLAGIAREKGRELTLPLDLSVVPDGGQAQQLMQLALNEAQRQRRHRLVLPPIAWLLEPGDVIAWTSVRNQYSGKLFVIEEMVGRRTLLQQAALREVDPADYDWSGESVIPVDHHPIAIVRPPAQSMSGFQVFPATFEAPSGEGYPSIEVRFDTDLDDVRAIRVQVRLTSDEGVVFDGEVPYEADGSGRIVLNAVFLPDTDYQVRARYVPFSARETEWSAWLAVRTPDTRFIMSPGPGSIDFDKLGDDVTALQRWLAEKARGIEEDAQRLHRLVAEMQLSDYDDRSIIRTELRAGDDNLRAGYTQAIIAATGPGSSLAGRIETVEAAVDDLGDGLSGVAGGLSSLTARVEETEDAIVVQASQIASLSSTLSSAETAIAANAGAISALDTRVNAAEGEISAQASQITALESGLSGLDGDVAANALAIAGLDTRVTSAEDAIDAQAAQLVVIEASLASAEGDITANASAISSLNSTASSHGSQLSALASALIGVNAATGGSVANARFAMEAATTPSDALARLALKVAASGGGSLVEAGIFLDAMTGGVSRVVVAADKLAIQSGVNSRFAPFLVDGGVVYIDKARIRDLIADNWDFNAAVSMGATYNTAQISTTSTSFVNMTGMNGLTRVFGEDCIVMIVAQGILWVSGSSGRTIEVILQTSHPSQGTRSIGTGVLLYANGPATQEPRQAMGFGMIDCVGSETAHTFSLQWRLQGGSGTANASHMRLGLLAFKKATFSGLTGSSAHTGGGSGSGGTDGRWDADRFFN